VLLLSEGKVGPAWGSSDIAICSVNREHGKGSYFHLSANVAGACIPECEEDVDPLVTEAFRAALVTSSLHVF